MKSVDIGVLDHSVCFSFSPSEMARQLLFYPTWCGHYFCTSAYFIRRQSFPPLLVVYVRKGLFEFDYRGAHFEARQGHVVLLDCSEPHYYRARDGLEFLYMHFDGSNAHEICQQILKHTGPLIRSENNYRVEKLLYDMVQFYQEDNIESPFQSSMRIYRLFEILMTPERQYEVDNPVDRAIRFIHENLRQDITLSMLADRVSLSPYYFAHLFKEQTGFAPIDYVTQARLNQARILLARTSKSISEIADEVGYASPSCLSNIFKRKEGMAPGRYRHLLRGKS